MLVVVLSQAPAVGFGEVDLENSQTVKTHHILRAIMALKK